MKLNLEKHQLEPIVKNEKILELQTQEIVFDLARSIDLHKISTEQTNEEAIDGVTSGLIGHNEWVTWRAKHFGIYQTLTSKITAFDLPTYFIFSENNGVTTMIDIFDYESPFGFIGKLADWFFLEKYMTALLDKRNNTIKEFTESDRWKEVLK